MTSHPVQTISERDRAIPRLTAASLAELLRVPLPNEAQHALREHVRIQRWFRSKARTMTGLEILDHVPLSAAGNELVLTILRVHYGESSELYVMPLALDTTAAHGTATHPLFELALAGGAVGTVYDPAGNEQLAHCLLDILTRTQTLGEHGRITALAEPALTARLQTGQPPLPARIPSGEQSNTSVFFGQEFMLKLFRLLETGENPDLEITEFLWARGYRNVPEPVGSMTYERAGLTATLGIAQRYVPSRGTAWDVTLELLQRSFQAALALAPDTLQQLVNTLPSDDLLESSQQTPPEHVSALIGPYESLARLLGQRTAELHIVLASDHDSAAFKPEPFTADYQEALAQNARNRITRMYDLLSAQLTSLPDAVQPLARDVLACRSALSHKLTAASAIPLHASRIRCHGDYHLGQVLYTGTDFTILDFEGEPAQPIEARRLKLSALYDVCGMLRSFHYAATFALQGAGLSQEDRAKLGGASETWYRWTSAVFLRAYLRTVRAADRNAVFLPREPEQLRALLPLHMIDKCSYELGYELNNRPAWVGVPLAGLLSLSTGR